MSSSPVWGPSLNQRQNFAGGWVDLIHAKTAVFFLPPVISVLTDSHLTTGLTYGATLALKYLHLAQNPDRFLYAYPLGHTNTPFPDRHNVPENWHIR